MTDDLHVDTPETAPGAVPDDVPEARDRDLPEMQVRLDTGGRVEVANATDGAPDGSVSPLDRQDAVARWLAAMPAGLGLHEVLERVDLDALTAFERVELVVAAGRLEARAHALKARAAAAVDRHPDMRPPREGRVGTGKAWVSRHLTAATLAMRLHVPLGEADLLVAEGIAYGGMLADTGAMLADGHVSRAQARVLVRRLGDQPWPVALAVQERVLPGAPGRTVAQLRADVERELVRVDGEHAADRHRHARARRCVSRPKALEDGMAGMWLVLPAVEAARVDLALDAAARRSRATPEDDRTLDQLRADALVARILAGHPRAEIAGAQQRDPAGHEQGDPRPEDKHPVEPRPTRDDSAAHGAASPAEGSATGARVLLTVPLSTLLGLDDEPGDLAGHGPLDAVTARELALDLGSVWQRVVTDGLSGAVLDVGRTTYRPPAALDEHVRHRDKYCAAPGCPVPAARTDLDHTREYHPAPDGAPRRPLGTTSHDNLGPLCRHHHRLKTIGALRLRQPSPGEFTWTTPTGHRFRTRPGTDEPTTHLTGPAPPAPADLPPF